LGFSIYGNKSILFIALSTENVTPVLLVLNYFPALNSIDEKVCSSLLIAAQQGNREYERERLHQNMIALQNIQQKISETTSGRRVLS
jgi:hypothetical protein